MYVRMQIGRYAGQIVDVEPVAAKQMLADGRGSDPYAPARTEEAETPAPSVKAPKVLKRKR